MPLINTGSITPTYFLVRAVVVKPHRHAFWHAASTVSKGQQHPRAAHVIPAVTLPQVDRVPSTSSKLTRPRTVVSTMHAIFANGLPLPRPVTAIKFSLLTKPIW